MKSLKSQIPHDDCLNIYKEIHVPITLYVYILDNSFLHMHIWGIFLTLDGRGTGYGNYF